MSADFSKPSVTSTKTSFPQEIRDNDDVLATMFEADATSANKPTNAKRMDIGGTVYYWNGSSWVTIGTIGATEVDDTAYGAGWNGETAMAPSKNAVYDEIESVKGTIPAVEDTAYGAGWNGDTDAPSKNAVYDKIESLGGGDVLDGTKGTFSVTGTTWTTITTATSGLFFMDYHQRTTSGFRVAGNTRIDLSDDSFVSTSWNTAYSGTITTGSIIGRIQDSGAVLRDVEMRRDSGNLQIRMNSGTTGTSGFIWVIL